MKFKIGLLCFVLIGLLMTVLVAAAQETPVPALPTTTESPQEILTIVLNALFGGAVTIAGSTFVAAVVGLEKLLIPASVVSADTLKNITSVVVWLVYSLAIHFGVGDQAQGIAQIITPILVSATPLVGVLIGSSLLHQQAIAHNTPLVGYQRTPAS